MEVGQRILVVSCISSRTITTYLRSSMEVIEERSFNNYAMTYGRQLAIVEHFDGEQNFVFYTADGPSVHQVGVFEVLINDELPAKDQYIYEMGYNFPELDLSGKNYG